jgi:drug/metabolite transporter (DMT)-like permease
MSSIHYANLANINFGIISCCFIVSVVVNSAAGLVFFNEKLTRKLSLGICVTMTGIIWISLAKGGDAVAMREGKVEINLDDIILNKSKAIVLALAVGVGNSMQTIQSKFMMKNPVFKTFGVISIVTDIGLVFVLLSSSLTVFFYFSGEESINAYNFTLTFFTSILGMLCWLLG